MVARLEEDRLHRHQPARVGAGCRERQSQDRRPAIPGWCRSARSIRCGARTRSGLPIQLVSSRSTTRSLSATSETGETKQVTDGLADAVWPAWDASGKYLWFLASTDFGLRSQWLDMTSYDREENFGLYLAVLKRGEPSPLLPESDEDAGVGNRPAGPAPAPNACTARRGGGGGGGHRRESGSAGDQPAAPPRARTPVTVQIDFDGLQQRIISVEGVPERAILEPARRRGRNRLLPRSDARWRWTWRRGRRQHAAAVSAERAPSVDVCERRRRIRSQRRRLQAALSHRRRRRRPRPSGRRGRHDADGQPVSRGRGIERRRRVRDASTPRCGCISSRKKSSSRSSTRAGAISAITFTCRTCTAPTGRR